MEFRALVTDNNIYKKYVEVLNSLFRLAERELDVFSLLIKIQLNWGLDIPIDIIDTRSRRQLMRETLINKNNLSKYLQVLKNNKILIYNENRDGWVINPSLLPKVIEDKISVNFTLQKKDNE